MKSYEIQTLREGKWAIDSIFNDRDLALFEARRVDENRRYMGVRVIEEVYDEQSGLTTHRTIFRGSKSRIKKHDRGAAPGKRATVAPARGGTGQEPAPRSRAHREPEKKKSTLLVPVLLVILVLFLGLAGLFGLQLLSARV